MSGAVHSVCALMFIRQRSGMWIQTTLDLTHSVAARLDGLLTVAPRPSRLYLLRLLASYSPVRRAALTVRDWSACYR